MLSSVTDDRILGKIFREFLAGYAVGSQGKNVDHVRAATNAQQWYVTISCGKRKFSDETAALKADMQNERGEQQKEHDGWSKENSLSFLIMHDISC